MEVHPRRAAARARRVRILEAAREHFISHGLGGATTGTDGTFVASGLVPAFPVCTRFPFWYIAEFAPLNAPDQIWKFGNGKDTP